MEVLVVVTVLVMPGVLVMVVMVGVVLVLVAPGDLWWWWVFHCPKALDAIFTYRVIHMFKQNPTLRVS